MPTLTASTLTCTLCHNDFNFLELRVAPEYNVMLCPSCWEQRCFFCTECEEVAYTRNRNATRDNRVICDSCYNRNIWKVIPSNVSIASYTNIGSKRKYGIELETASCPDYQELKGKTIFGAKTDCSVSGMEFISPILYGDEGLQEVFNFLEFTNGFTVDNTCGYHLHIDVRDENPVQLRHIVYAYAKTYETWKRLVASHRPFNSYCARTQYSAEEIRAYNHNIVNYFRGCSRYAWFNVNAYEKYKTFEIRLHEGTMHYKTIIYWAMAHTRFVDAVKDMRYEEIDRLLDGAAIQQFDVLKAIWNQSGQRISEFYQRRFNYHV